MKWDYVARSIERGLVSQYQVRSRDLGRWSLYFTFFVVHRRGGNGYSPYSLSQVLTCFDGG